MRWGIAVGLVVVAAVLAPVAVVARYVRSDLLDTESYVSAVVPLAEDRAVKGAVVDVVTREVVGFLDIEGDGLARDALGDLGLAGPLADQVEEVTREEVGELVDTDEFADVWARANRVAHDGLEAALTGETDGAVDVDTEEGRVSIDLGEIVDRLRQRLVDIGLERDVVDRIPDVDARLTILESDDLARSQGMVRLLDRVAIVLPFVVVALVVAAVVVAPDRRRAVLVAAAGITLGMVALAAGFVLVREWYVDDGTPRALPPDAAVAFARAVLAPLRGATVAVLVVGVVVTAVALAAGPSGPARAVRRTVGRRRPTADRPTPDRPAGPAGSSLAATMGRD